MYPDGRGERHFVSYYGSHWIRQEQQQQQQQPTVSSIACSSSTKESKDMIMDMIIIPISMTWPIEIVRNRKNHFRDDPNRFIHNAKA
jgi:hypothetical protein